MDTYLIETGETGYSVCHKDHTVVGECVIEGIQHYGIAQEVAEMLAGETEAENDPCVAAEEERIQQREYRLAS
ncbi:MAG: hypothetical protein G8345_13235 [Magnetococcales bacterium]|nr:hypothetical protein [Magnetococcales bacterium]NGZ27837.1 hypothetical protein [Magnetococcales bacterium]